MARITRPLTNNEIRKAKPREKDYTLHDGDGLFLLVKASGEKTLALPLSTTGKQQPHKFESRLIPCPCTRSSSSDTRPALNHAHAGHGSATETEQASEQRLIELDSIFSTVAANWL